MKKQKQPDAMYSTDSFTDLTAFRSGTKIGDSELVIACGYTQDGRYGYFIIEEQQTIDAKTKRPKWTYRNQRSFLQKKNEQSYREILQQLKQLTG